MCALYSRFRRYQAPKRQGFGPARPADDPGGVNLEWSGQDQCPGRAARRGRCASIFPGRLEVVAGGRLSPVGTFAISHAAQARGSTGVRQRAPAGRLKVSFAPLALGPRGGLRINECTVHGLAPVAISNRPACPVGAGLRNCTARIFPRTGEVDVPPKQVTIRAGCCIIRQARFVREFINQAL